ncbi:MAG: hypothetical protein JXO72_03495 [Vicinamibacteria bacterium]|nr:hypothetical protein [Vicinamibacteria bacterium]
MTDLLRWSLIVWFAGGGFIAGVIGIGAVSAISVFRPRPRRMLPRVIAYIALPLLALSAIPMPWWLYLAYSGATLAWCEMERRVPDSRPLIAVPRIIVASSSLLVAGWFLVRQIPHRLPHVDKTPIVVLRTTQGDDPASEDSWPRMLATLLGAPIDDRSLSLDPSQTAEHAFLTPRPGIVIVEIGPHEFFARITARETHDGIERLLAMLARRKHAVIMLETPLGPLENRHGEILRRLARRYDVMLIPRWVLARAWVDSAAGPAGREEAQRFIARRLHEVLRPLRKSQARGDG